jgi:hypothetical protein
VSGGKLEGSAGAIFWRAVTNGNLIVAETVAREFEVLPLDYALALVRLYGEKGNRRYEPAALRYLERYIVEERPSLEDLAGIASLLAERKPG